MKSNEMPNNATATHHLPSHTSFSLLEAPSNSSMPSATSIKQIKRSSISSCLNCTESMIIDQDNIDHGSIFFLSTHLSDKGLARLTHGLEDPCMQLPKCYKLHLCDNNISSRGADLLSEVVRNSHNLVELSLGNNNIGDDGAEYLSVSLRQNRSLKMLNLEKNGIGCHGVTCLAGALSIKSVSTLRWLVLSENPVGDAGARALLNCVRNNQSLKSVLNDSNHSLYSVVLKKVNIKDTALLRDMHCFLKLNRLYSSSSGGIAETVKRKIKLCVKDEPKLLLDYLIQNQKQEFKLLPEFYSFFAQDITTLFHMLRHSISLSNLE
jgi:hypothetical protein